MSRFALACGSFVVLLTAAPGSLVASFSVGTNLIVNGDAETGSGSPDGDTIFSVPNWTTSGAFNVVKYGAPGGFPTITDPGPASRGKNFFAGGPANASSSATQAINIADGAVTIDGGLVTFGLTGYLGGFSTQGDNAVLTLTFLNAGAVSLGTATIGPVTNTDRGDATGLLSRSTTGTVPVGTRSLSVTLQMTRTNGSYNDGYADNLSLILANGPTVATPAPATFALFAFGSVAGGLWTRRRRGTPVADALGSSARSGSICH